MFFANRRKFRVGLEISFRLGNEKMICFNVNGHADVNSAFEIYNLSELHLFLKLITYLLTL